MKCAKCLTIVDQRDSSALPRPAAWAAARMRCCCALRCCSSEALNGDTVCSLLAVLAIKQQLHVAHGHHRAASKTLGSRNAVRKGRNAAMLYHGAMKDLAFCSIQLHCGVPNLQSYWNLFSRAMYPDMKTVHSGPLGNCSWQLKPASSFRTREDLGARSRSGAVFK